MLTLKIARPKQRFKLVLLVLVISLGTAFTSQAQSTTTSISDDQLYNKAINAYNGQDWMNAAILFSAYLDRDPAALKNNAARRENVTALFNHTQDQLRYALSISDDYYPKLRNQMSQCIAAIPSVSGTRSIQSVPPKPMSPGPAPTPMAMISDSSSITTPAQRDEPQASTSAQRDEPRTSTSNNERLFAQIVDQMNASDVKNSYPYEAELFVRHLLALDLSDDMVAALQQPDTGDRIRSIVHRVWKDWEAYGIDHMTADPGQNGQSPFRQLVIRITQGQLGALNSTDRRALTNFLTRAESADTWRNNARGVIGAINAEVYGQ